MMPEFESLFARLRGILQKHAGTLSVADDTPARYCLEANIGPATLQAWGGRTKRPTIPVAWVEIGKTDVSYHLMGVYGDAALRNSMSKELRARMQGKTCFNFTSHDEARLTELETLTSKSIASFKKAGFISSAAAAVSRGFDSPERASKAVAASDVQRPGRERSLRAARMR